MYFEDGQGSGRKVGVNSYNQLLADISQMAKIAYISKVDAEAYAWSSVSYDTDAADTILLVRNDHHTKNLHITKIVVSVDTASDIQIQCPTATFTIAGTAVVGRNLHRGSSNLAEATAKTDETGNTQGHIIEQRYAAANANEEFDFKGALILGHNEAVGIDVVGAGTAEECTIYGYFL